MNLLIINSSPRKEGNISQMLREIEREAVDRELHIDRIDVYGLNIAPCRGCMTCRSTGECSMPRDDAQRVLTLIRQADIIAIGAPCYWGNMPGPLKTLFDRMVYGFIADDGGMMPRPLLKGRRMIIVTACTTAAPWHRLTGQTSGTAKSLKKIFRLAGIRRFATLQRPDTRRRPLTAADLSRARHTLTRLL